MDTLTNPVAGVQVRPRSSSSPVTSARTLFGMLTAAIQQAYGQGDDHLVDLLLAAKLAAVRQHHDALEGR